MTLVRQTSKRTSYYSVVLYPTLFDDYMLVHHCGMNCSKKSQRVYFESKKEALFESLNIIGEQKKRGFVLLKNQE